MAKPQPSTVAEPEQPALFPPELLPDEPKLLAAVKRWEHQAKALTKDEEKAFAVCEALTSQGWGIRRVCRAYLISPSTVYKLMENLEQSGKLETYKQRISKTMGMLAELGAEASIDMVLAGKVPANVLPIMFGTAFDKKALVEGDVTARVETVETRRLELSDITSYLQAKGVVIDVDSTVLCPKPKETPP